MPGLSDLNKIVQPITGPASMDAAIAALSPQELAMAQAGIDPYGADQGMMQGQPGIAQAQSQGAISQPATLTPEARMAIGQVLQESLAAIGQPASEQDAVAAQSIQNALMALTGGM